MENSNLLETLCALITETPRDYVALVCLAGQIQDLRDNALTSPHDRKIYNVALSSLHDDIIIVFRENIDRAAGLL